MERSPGNAKSNANNHRGGKYRVPFQEFQALPGFPWVFTPVRPVVEPSVLSSEADKGINILFGDQ